MAVLFVKGKRYEEIGKKFNVTGQSVYNHLRLLQTNGLVIKKKLPAFNHKEIAKRLAEKHPEVFSIKAS